jgi:hypothetical protein
MTAKSRRESVPPLGPTVPLGGGPPELEPPELLPPELLLPPPPHDAGGDWQRFVAVLHHHPP